MFQALSFCLLVKTIWESDPELTHTALSRKQLISTKGSVQVDKVGAHGIARWLGCSYVQPCVVTAFVKLSDRRAETRLIPNVRARSCEVDIVKSVPDPMIW